MHAIIETGGKQYRVAPGDVIRVEKLGAETGAAVDLPKVLAVFRDNGDVLTTTELEGAKVVATVTGQDRSKKILVFKFKRKKQYKKTIGHRQPYTELRVNEIVV